MCGRYITAQAAAFEKAVRLGKITWRFEPSYNVAPTQSVPVVRWEDGDSVGLLMRWSLIPFFAKGEPPKYSTINARIETVETAASYRGPWKRGQRCLQLAAGFYEWHVDETGRKAPHLIQLNDPDVFCLCRVIGSVVQTRWHRDRECRSHHDARQRTDAEDPQHRQQSPPRAGDPAPGGL